MALSQEQIASIEPMRDKLGDALESPTEYTNRVKFLLPNFPEEVLSQWFQDHQNIIKDYAWLDYPSLRFVLSELAVKDLALPCLANHETVVQYRDHFLNGGESPRMIQLAEYIAAHGTWPVAPLVLNNSIGAIVTPGDCTTTSHSTY